jgi:hypothetical protein
MSSTTRVEHYTRGTTGTVCCWTVANHGVLADKRVLPARWWSARASLLSTVPHAVLASPLPYTVPPCR